MGQFVSVAWLAEHQKLDTGTIRQRIYGAKLDAFKVGNDWRIWIDEEKNYVLRLTPVVNRRGIAKREYYFKRSRHRRSIGCFDQYHS